MSLLKEKVEQVKREIGYKSLSKMSYDLGFHYNYLNNTLREGLTPKAEAKLIAKLDALLEQNKQELTHDFNGNSLNKKIYDAVMISKSELDSLKKEISHKTQVAEKHNDMRAKAEEKMLLAEQSAERWEKDFWTMTRDNMATINENEELKKQIDLIKVESEKWESEYWKLSNITTDLKSKISKLELNNRNQRGEIECLAKHLDGSERLRENMSDEILKLKSKNMYWKFAFFILFIASIVILGFFK